MSYSISAAATPLLHHPAAAAWRAPPYSLNTLLTAGVAATWLFLLVGLPHIGLGVRSAAMLAGLVALAVTPLHAALVHEAIHSNLLRGEPRNRTGGRLLGICSGVSFDVLRFGHRTHHWHNRHPLDRAEAIADGAPLWRVLPLFYANLLGGVYLLEVLASIPFLLPRRAILLFNDRLFAGTDPVMVEIRGAARRTLAAPVTIRRVRQDFAAIVLLYGSSLVLCGRAWPVLAVTVAVRGLVISLLDNAHHYGSPLDSGTDVVDSILPRWAAPLVLNQNLHGTHHAHPTLPWTALPWAQCIDGGRPARPYLTAILQQLRGPVPIDDLRSGREVKADPVVDSLSLQRLESAP